MVHTSHHRYIVDSIKLNRKCLDAQFYTNHLLAKTNSLERNTGSSIYSTGIFTVAYSCTNCLEIGDTLRRLSDDVGIPDRLRSDMAPEITVKHTEFQDQVKRLLIYLRHLEVECSSHNHAMEGDIGHLKKSF